MRSCRMARGFWLAVGLVWLGELGWAPPTARSDEPPTIEQIAGWVDDLSAGQYAVRDAATRRLIKTGARAVEPVAEALSGNGLEVTARAVFILQELALSGDLETESAARGALEKAAALRVTTAARRASAALDKLDDARQKRVLEEFKRLGAKVDKEHVEMGLPDFGGIFAIEFGDQWQGQEKHLEQLKWLRDVDQVSFVGKQVKPDWVKYVNGMENLSILKIKRVPITDESLAVLPKLAKLQYVKLLYVPVTDQALHHLTECKRLSMIKLFGTKVTDKGEAKLRVAVVAEVDRRQGAFLGISPSHLGQNWFIRTVTEKSSADKAGLQPGDVITKYEQQPIGDFNSLTQMIAKNTAGDTVTLEILRGSRRFERKIKLGEWE